MRLLSVADNDSEVNARMINKIVFIKKYLLDFPACREFFDREII